MTEKELRRLRRSDLLELLLDQSRENENLRQDLALVRAQLADRTIQIENAGSLADAALALNGVFQAAEAACGQYLDNIRLKSQQADEYKNTLCAQLQERCGSCTVWKELLAPEQLEQQE